MEQTAARQELSAFLTSFWKRLNQSFARAMKAYRGSVADFVASLSADVHLVGRIFFISWKIKAMSGLLLFWPPMRAD